MGLLPPTSGSTSSTSAVPTTCDAGSGGGQQKSSGVSHHQHSALMQSHSDLETEMNAKHPILNNDNTPLAGSLSFHHVGDGNDNNIAMNEHSSYQHFLNDEVVDYNKCLTNSSVRQSQQTLSLPPPSSSSSVNLEAEAVANNYMGLSQNSNIANDVNNSINNHLYTTSQLSKPNQQQINDTIRSEHPLLDIKYDNAATSAAVSASLQKQITTVSTATVSAISDSNDCHNDIHNDIQNHDNGDNLHHHHHHHHQNHQNHLHDSYLTKNGIESVVSMVAAENNIEDSFNGKTVKRRGRKKKMLNVDGNSPIDR